MPSSRLRPTRLAVLCALLAIALPRLATANTYDLEMVVFLNQAIATSEVDRVDPERSARYNDLLGDRSRRTGTVIAETIDDGRLGEMAARLRSSGGHTVVQHVRWRQQVELIDDAPFVDVSALGLGEDSGLRGLVRFYHSPLLYVDLLLRFTPLTDALGRQPSSLEPGVADFEAPLQRQWFLEEKRRVKLKELHYFDNPYFGAILGVWPVEDSASSEGETAPAS